MKKSKAKTTNVTHERLSGLPFGKAGDLKEAERRIQQEVWEQVTRAKYFYELTKRDEYSFFKHVFETGIQCSFDTDVELVSLSVDKDGGFKLAIPEQLKSVGSAEQLEIIESLVKGFSESFMRNYLIVMGLLPDLKKNDIQELEA